MDYVRNQYEPIMSKKKMKELNTVTDKNYRKVCGEINRFLQNDVVALSGIRQKSLQKKFTESPKNVMDMFTKETYAIYKPYFGVCTIQNDQDAKEDGYRGLRIHSKYDVGHVDICIGDRYKLFGDRLVILQTHVPTDNVENCVPGYHEFVKTKHENAEEMIQYKCSGIEMVLWEDYELFMMVNPYIKQKAAENEFDVVDLSQTIVDALEKLCLEQNATGEHKITINVNKKRSFDIVVNVQDFLDQKTPLDIVFRWKNDGYEYEAPYFMGFLEDFPHPLEEYTYRDEDGNTYTEYIPV